MPKQELKILDGPLLDQETFLVDDRLMRMFDCVKVPEMEITYVGKREVRRFNPTGKHYTYMIVQEGLKYVD